ncbi:SAM-dependent methyltransferase [Flavilitoribacter nigricans]|uniref:hypothetical protein n=1 Tax=Flavilitoribacter nigricans TaxID=70997 RepID=UPI001179AE13|nr:hypothetical protein [Flavilitoribacter nigricans]
MKARFQEVAKVLLEEPEDLGTAWRACNLYKELLLELSELDLETEAARYNIALAQGMALGSTWAAYCLNDFLRTRRFIKGIHTAVAHLLTTRKNRPVHLLYAGTGPFATLVLPLLYCFRPEELQFTFLEINPISYHNLQKLLEHLDLMDYVRRLEPADATTYRIPPGETVDIVLSETMQAGLRREVQVPIFWNLLSQEAARQAIPIPERIELFMGAYRSNYEPSDSPPKAVKFGSYFRLDRDHIPDDRSGDTLPSARIKVPNNLDDGFDQLVIFTEIDIFQKQRLRHGDSGLTTPLIIRDIHRNPVKGQFINIRYYLREDPGECIEITNDPL